jgi:hypothetical protein
VSAWTLRPPLSRLAALMLLAAAAALVWFGLAQPLLERRAAALAEIETAGAQRARFRAALDSAAAPPPAAPESALLATEAPALAAAALQRRVDAAIVAAGGARSAVQPLPPETLDGALRVALSVEARFDAAALMRFLHAIETGEPFVFVERLEARRVAGAIEGESDAPDAIAVRMALSALMRPAEGGL